MFTASASPVIQDRELGLKQFTKLEEKKTQKPEQRA